MADSYVQVAPDSTGKLIDNAELTRKDGTVVERQRIVLASDEFPSTQALIGGESGRGYLLIDSRAFSEITMLMQEIITRLDMIIGE